MSTNKPAARPTVYYRDSHSNCLPLWMRQEHHCPEGRGFGGAFLDFASRVKHSCHIVFDAPERQYVVTIFYKRLPLDIPLIFKHKGIAAVAAHVAI